MIEIKTATTDQDIASCWEAMYLLRPQLKQEEFVAQIKALQQEGYTLLFLKAGERAVSVAGYRFFVHALLRKNGLYRRSIYTNNLSWQRVRTDAA